MVRPHIGSRAEVLQTLDLATREGYQTMGYDDSGIGEALKKCYKNKVKYRITLVNFDKKFGN
jgi:hypothetical protein